MQLALIGSVPCSEVVERQEFFAFCAPSAGRMVWYRLSAASGACVMCGACHCD